MKPVLCSSEPPGEAKGAPLPPKWGGSGPLISARVRQQGGFTLIDVLVLIVLLGTVSGSMMVLFSRFSEQSAAGLRQRQVLAIAQSLLAEIKSQPFTYCDPQSANVATAANAGACAIVDAMGPEVGESRYNAANRLDGVSDYQGLTLPGPGCPGGICDINGNLLNPPGGMLAGCTASVALVAQALGGVAALDAFGRPQVLRIAVTVNCPGATAFTLEGIKLRHAPNRV